MAIDPEIASWTILIVDDELANIAITEQALRHFGATVYTAANGAECLTILNRLKPTLILLDLSMPRMDGWETLRHIRANSATANLPVIAATAHAMGGDREKTLAAGFDDYIGKPFRLNAFLAQIKDCLKRHTEVPQHIADPKKLVWGDSNPRR